MNENICCECAKASEKLRLLWLQHIYRTRFFIVSVAGELKDVECVKDWLMKNPEDFGCFFEKFYGKKIGEKIKELFHTHLAIGGDLVIASKNGEKERAECLKKKWYKNAEDIACFLAKINCFYDEKMWQDMMFTHLKLTEQETNLRLCSRYSADIEKFCEIEREALSMAEEMAKGIEKQFCSRK